MQPIHDKIAKRVFKWVRPKDPFGAWKGGDAHPIRLHGIAWHKRLGQWYLWRTVGKERSEVIAYHPSAQRLFVKVERGSKDFVWLAPGVGQHILISNKDKSLGHAQIKHPTVDKWAPLENFTLSGLLEQQELPICIAKFEVVQG